MSRTKRLLNLFLLPALLWAMWLLLTALMGNLDLYEALHLLAYIYVIVFPSLLISIFLVGLPGLWLSRLFHKKEKWGSKMEILFTCVFGGLAGSVIFCVRPDYFGGIDHYSGSFFLNLLPFILFGLVATLLCRSLLKSSP